ncbi:MAG: methylated-DNA--[protein]-cysteine S-methyltransferase [Candidatus Gastranaerophilales bacterium]|nr:methylated-DNA--[protein]-cysteine S-methyltransferase [Candidatus Gastranaerophilales bacterium]
MYTSKYSSPLGQILLESDGTRITGLHFKDDTVPLTSELLIFKRAKIWLDKYFNRQNPSVNELDIAPAGTPFRQRVFKALISIPQGKTLSYKEIANNIGSLSSRAAASAIADNPILIIIPCHRVIGANGELRGYSAGIELKKKLLEFEGAI